MICCREQNGHSPFPAADFSGSREQNTAPALPANKKTGGNLPSVLRAPRNSEMLNLWRDFLKVVDFIYDNHEWLSPLLAQTDKMKQ
jgi:hypothetical protein